MVLERQPMPYRKPIRQPKARSADPIFMSTNLVSEGGVTTPSKVVQFQENFIDQEAQHPIIQAIKTMDLRTGFVLAEVLKRPYN